MEKGTKVEEIYATAEKLHQAGVRVGFFLQFGYPGESRADIERTLQMVRDCQPDDVGMSVSYPLPGTKFYERVKIQLGDKQNWQDSSDLAMMYRGPFTTDFYRHLHVVLHKEFRSQRAWHDLRTAVRHPRRLRPNHLRRAAGLLYRQATLPLARYKLNQLAQQDNAVALAPELSLEEAATPSKQ
jgi:radical SAM superfamily enzyme YgiQ (UPF0313 family)